jgi:hypothetical protein
MRANPPPLSIVRTVLMGALVAWSIRAEAANSIDMSSAPTGPDGGGWHTYSGTVTLNGSSPFGASIFQISVPDPAPYSEVTDITNIRWEEATSASYTFTTDALGPNVGLVKWSFSSNQTNGNYSFSFQSKLSGWTTVSAGSGATGEGWYADNDGHTGASGLARVPQTPEPSSLVLFAVGTAVLSTMRGRRRHPPRHL